MNSDADSYGDACDNCPNDDNEEQTNSDNDSYGDACDNCPTISNEAQLNSDTDNYGNACDNCPTADNEDQADSDGDGFGDACDYVCADPNNDDDINILDVVYLINFKYKGGPAPDPMESGDINNDGNINILDIVYLINYKYKGGPTPECASPIGEVIDIDGNVYQTIKIGDQWWMMENLKVTHYRNGDPIPNVTSGWSTQTEGAYCNYNNDEGMAAVYGRLYNWYTVADSRGLAPTGWHVPTDAEMQTLSDFLGGDAVAGAKMKEAGTVHWLSPNTGATNESGFTGLPGGSRSNAGAYGYMGAYGSFWSATEYNSLRAWDRTLSYDNTDFPPNHEYRYKKNGFSVRCVKD